MERLATSRDIGRKIVLGCVAAGLMAMLLSSFAYRAQGPGPKPQDRTSADRMKKVQSLMDHLKHSPDDLDVIATIAEEFSEMGDWANAEKFWRKSVGLQPGNAVRQFHLAVSLLQQDRLQEAVPELEKTLELQPDNAVAYFYLGMIHKTTLGAPEIAKRHLQKVIELNPSHKELREEAEKELQGL